MLALKLILSHFLGDFVLQFDGWVKDKEKNKLKSKFLYLHTFVHASLMFLLLGLKKEYVGIVIIISLFHLLIDAVKLLKPIKNKRILFFADQLAHLAVIGVVVFVYQGLKFRIPTLITEKSLLLAIAILIVTVVSSIVLKVVFSLWGDALKKINKSDSSLKNAGKYIGMLERLLVFVFIVLDKWEAIGFLLAAKSVFRFGDLTNAKDRLLTEYVLIGTLLSFGIAIATGLLYLKLLTFI
ncbi:hypothetical protein FHR24_002169 [Wenyingzhuangia heitensis]|uniref:DUF3307 domain-containing protein n=1 Tax=Wenyingzhuangia heitensis TaxID=1487859 RepID=A0ABX0UE23_9FLAO|nr:DUF3307 domain-containing protein [Wenyingzhuangia heitensis]NIJ45701.1 hypothetical protein [Wenyingzhuangia heitensis]